MSNENANNPELFIDNERYDWEQETITGAQLRELAGLPDNVEIFRKIPGAPDALVANDTVVDLSHPGPERFSSQPVGSQAG